MFKTWNFPCFLTCFILVNVLGSPIPLNEDEILVKEYFEGISQDYKNLRNRIQQLVWSEFANATQNDFDLLRNGFLEARSLYLSMANGTRGFNQDEIHNADIKRQIQLVNSLRTMVLEKDDFITFHRLLAKLMREPENFYVKKYEDKTHSILANEAQSLILLSDDVKELQYYDRAVKMLRANRTSKTNFTEFAELYRKAADLHGSLTPTKFWYLPYEDENLLDELMVVVEDLHPLYGQLHAYTRRILTEKYGSDIMMRGELIPEYLMQHLLKIGLKRDFDFPYPYRFRFNVTEALQELNYSPIKLLKSAENFFISIGMTEIERDFWETGTRPIPRSYKREICQNEVFDFITHSKIHYCPIVSYAEFIDSHRSLSTIEYNSVRSNLPIFLNKENTPGFDDALQFVASLAAFSPEYLEQLGFIRRDSHDIESSINNLYFLAVMTIFPLFSALVREKFWLDVLNKKITEENYNCAYWDLYEEFTGIQISKDYNVSGLDLPKEFYENLDDESQNTRNIFGPILGFSFFKSICESIDEEMPEAQQKPLNQCNLANSSKAGYILKKLMSMGSKENWRNIIEPVTKSRKLKADGILKYFEPLLRWLEEENKKHYVNIGWEYENRCTPEDIVEEQKK